MTFSISTAQARQFENKLRDLNKRGIPFAELETLNRTAFETQKTARQQLSGRMVLRNQWTERSIQVDKANRRTMEAATGSTAQYMETQELGGREEAQGNHGVAIPTAVASGEGKDARPRQRLVRRPNQIKNISLHNRRKPKQAKGGREQHNAVEVKQALRQKTGKRYAFLDLGRTKGIFRILGGRRRTRIEMVHDLSRKAVGIPRNPWLMPAAEKQLQRQPRYYAEALQRQLAQLR